MSQTGMEDNLYTADQFIEIFGGVIADALKRLRELQPSVGIVSCKDCKHNYLDGIQVQFNRCELNIVRCMVTIGFVQTGKGKTNERT